MVVQPSYFEYVLEQLASLPALRPNRMFGGIGLYSDGIFFGLIDDDTLFFKTNESNIAAYRERNMPRFMPFPDRPEAVLGYHQVPADVIEDAETLVAWARQSIQVQLALQAKMPKRAAKVKTKAKAARRPARKRDVKPAKRPKATVKTKAAKTNVKAKGKAKKATTRKRARR
jgi:DNA transformation protein